MGATNSGTAEERKARKAARVAARQARVAARAEREAAPVADGGVPLPPIALAARVAGTEDMKWFHESGALTVGDWRRALAAAGHDFDGFARIVDFGCGCGRVLRHLRGALRPEQELIGLDVDAQAVAWVNANLPGVSAYALGLMPPSPIANDAIDLIVNQSVFTHLPEDVGLAWLDDLRRILRPGGIAVLSFHGRSVWPQFREGQRTGGMNEDELIRADAQFHRSGFFYGAGRNGFEGALPDYYGTAVHRIDYIEAEWGRRFEILAWLPRASLHHQDIVVLRKN